MMMDIFGRKVFVYITGAVLLLFVCLPGMHAAAENGPADETLRITGEPWSDSALGRDSRITPRVDAYDFGDPTESEQMHLELLNRARMDPHGEAARLGIDLFEGVPEGKISGEPGQPLTFNSKLLLSARLHSQDMEAKDFFAHNNQDPIPLSPFDRIRNQGYDYANAAENLAASFSTGSLDTYTEVVAMHDRLFIDKDIEDRGHRVNQVNGKYKEVGIGVALGNYNEWSAAVFLTCDFGSSRSDDRAFITGVVYDDRDGDRFYGKGEGLGDVTIRITETGDGTITASAGGYGIPVSPGSYTVKATLSDGRGAQGRAVVSDENVKVDFLLSEFTGGIEPAPVITAGNADSSLTVTEGEEVVLRLSIAPGFLSGSEADWWLLQLVDDQIGYFDFQAMDFINGISPTLQGTLVEVPPTELALPLLSQGIHTFYLGFDSLKNGVIDLDRLYYDSVQVEVLAP